MEAGTVLLGVAIHALGITFVTLTACILLYLIIWGFLHWGDFLYKKMVRRRKIRAIVMALKREVLAAFKRAVVTHEFTTPLATRDELKMEIKHIEEATRGETVKVRDPALYNCISLENLKRELGL